jgi:hypothetical protein
MAVWILSPGWRSSKPKDAILDRHIGEAGEGFVGRAPYLHYTLAFALKLRKNRGKLSAFPKAS